MSVRRTLYCDDEPEYKYDLYDQHIDMEQPSEAQQQEPPIASVEAEGPLLVLRLLMTNEKEDPKVWR